MINIGVLGSTNGSDMESVISSIKSGKIEAKISVVISNNADAYILERAKMHNIEAVFIDLANKSREVYEQKIIELLESHDITLILLIGYMRLLSGEFVRKYKNRIINVHPSLLPAFSGGMDKNVHSDVLKYGVKITGCTVHFVDENTDAGPIILQKAVAVEDNDTADTLKARVQKAEREILPYAVELFVKGKLEVVGRKVYIK